MRIDRRPCCSFYGTGETGASSTFRLNRYLRRGAGERETGLRRMAGMRSEWCRM